MGELVKSESGGLDPKRKLELIRAFFASLKPNTKAFYKQDLTDFAHFAALDGDLDKLAAFVGSTQHGEANSLALNYLQHMKDRGLAPSTINRRLSALRSLVRMARTIGLVPWTLEVPGLKTVAYRDTKGPGARAVLKVIAKLDRRRDPQGIRDLAIMRLMHDLILRRAEISKIDLKHFQEIGPDGKPRVEVTRKKRTQSEWLTIPASTTRAVMRWLAVRGVWAGPLFIGLDKASKAKPEKDRRLSPESIRLITKLHFESIGAKNVSPHRVRHSTITEALDKTDGDLRKVQRLTGHADVKTLMVYDDARQDAGGEVSDLLAGDKNDNVDDQEDNEEGGPGVTAPKK